MYILPDIAILSQLSFLLNQLHHHQIMFLEFLKLSISRQIKSTAIDITFLIN